MRPSAGKAFEAEFLQVTTIEDREIARGRMRVLQDRQGRQRVETQSPQFPEIWFGVVYDWVAQEAFPVGRGAPLDEAATASLPAVAEGQWEMGLAVGKWDGPHETQEVIDGYNCRRLTWRQVGGDNQLSVWLFPEIDYPIRQEFVVDGIRRLVALDSFSATNPAPELFRRTGGP